jgi:hypothetical protein
MVNRNYPNVIFLKKNTIFLKLRLNVSYDCIKLQGIALLFLICTTRPFAMILSRFQQHHLDLDLLLEKVFELKIL